MVGGGAATEKIINPNAWGLGGRGSRSATVTLTTIVSREVRKREWCVTDAVKKQAK